MIAQRIQGDYDHLQEILRQFMRHADMTVALTVQVEGLVDQLQGGAWRGVGAEAFYAEMGDLILPAMRKLEDALQFAGEGTGKIHHILREAEEEAARLFQAMPEWDSLAEYTPPTTDDSPADEKEKLEKLKKLLEAYGITVTGKWSSDNLEGTYETINKVGIRLEQFAVGIYGIPVPSGAELFKMLFGKDGKLTLRRGEGQETKEGAWATNDLNGTITFYGKAFFPGEKNILKTLLSKVFPTTFTSEFLILHELGHCFDPEMKLNTNRSQPRDIILLGEYFKGSNSALRTTLSILIKAGNIDPDLGSAGFRFAARSENTPDEFLADAIANWILNSLGVTQLKEKQ
ncbi:hypothetical protein ANRL2_01286 [Anaerolineae bacterium]|nr:hypothetical protein ANRL2_01286 [Anaerolineae bacterium]